LNVPALSSQAVEMWPFPAYPMSSGGLSVFKTAAAAGFLRGNGKGWNCHCIKNYANWL